MNISIIATAFSGYGTLTIYSQLLEAVKKENEENYYHFFVADWMPQPIIDKVTYHVVKKRKGLHRFLFDIYGFKRLSKELGIKWDVVVSLQNVPVAYSKQTRNIVYFHQALTLYNYPISLFDKFAKTYYIYHYIYSFYISIMLRHANYVAVQTQTIRNLYSHKFSFPKESIGVFFPNMEEARGAIEEDDKICKGKCNFIYPGTANTYKEHLTLVEAVKRIKEMNPQIAEIIKIHFTVKEKDNPELTSAIISNGLSDVFCFHGTMPHNELINMYQGCDGLLFPSVIETIGLPLLESAAFGLPVLANDIDFAHEVLEGYDGVKYIELHNFDEWAQNIIDLATNRRRFKFYKRDNNNAWGRFLQLVTKGVLN